MIIFGEGNRYESGLALGEGRLSGGREEGFSDIFHYCNIKEDLLVAFKTKCFATRFEPGLIKVLFAR